jgi:MOSC domain-containing protein YiiM
MDSSPTIAGIFIAETQAAQMSAVEEVQAIAGCGLVGDRYFLGTGKFSTKDGWGANVTLIQSEAIDSVNAGHQENFTGLLMRRNLVTAGIDLNSLLGQTFRCGGAILRGTKPYPPCTHLARLLGDQKVLQYFAYCAGIGAEVIADGLIRLNDRIEMIAPE